MIRLLLISFLLACAACSADLVKAFTGCTLVDVRWNDGDSFRVRFPDGGEHTIRLYGVDCMEYHVEGDDSNARRLRDQRRHFGIADILVAKSYGESAAVKTKELLTQPFVVHTAFADGRGDARYSRIYAFVTTAGGFDLSELLVTEGLARAFGVCRQRPDGTSADEWQSRLADLELTAAKAGRGAWSRTDWSRLPEFRKEARVEIAEVEQAREKPQPSEDKPLDLNTASRDELMGLPGVGEKTAMRIIRARPFQSIEELQRIKGIGADTFAKIRPFVMVESR